MSHATGIVYQGKTVIGYFEYDGTCDVACTAIQATRDEVWDIHWRKPTAYRTCTCEMHVIADVELEHDYGGGYRWESQACLTCMTITGEREPHGRHYGRGRDGKPVPGL